MCYSVLTIWYSCTQNLLLIWLSNLVIISVPNECYFRYASFTLKLIIYRYFLIIIKCDNCTTQIVCDLAHIRRLQCVCKMCCRICTLRHTRIQIIHGSHNVMRLSALACMILAHFILSTNVKTNNVMACMI